MITPTFDANRVPLDKIAELQADLAASQSTFNGGWK